MNNIKSSFEKELDKTGILFYRNVGDSMLPLIRQYKDIIVITKPEGWKGLPNDGVKKLRRLECPLYKRDSGQYVLHRVLNVQKSGYVLCGDNRIQREYGISDRHIIGVLYAVIRDAADENKSRMIFVTDFKYRLYVHLWCDFFCVRVGILRLKTFLIRIKKKVKDG